MPSPRPVTTSTETSNVQIKPTKDNSSTVKKMTPDLSGYYGKLGLYTPFS